MNFGGRPQIRPSCRAASNPALVRSLSMALSAPKMNLKSSSCRLGRNCWRVQRREVSSEVNHFVIQSGSKRTSEAACAIAAPRRHGVPSRSRVAGAAQSEQMARVGYEAPAGMASSCRGGRSAAGASRVRLIREQGPSPVDRTPDYRKLRDRQFRSTYRAPGVWSANCCAK